MPFLDTSVIVRYLTGDHPELSKRAAEIIDAEDEIVITEVVIVETAYVLTRLYEVERQKAVDALIAFIQLPQLSVDGMKKSLVYEALLLCRPSHRVSFADAFIRAAARRRKETVIYSFDKRFPGDGMEIRG